MTRLSQDVVLASRVSPLAVVGLVLGKAEVQGSNPCRGTTQAPEKIQLFFSGANGSARIMRGACGWNRPFPASPVLADAPLEASYPWTARAEPMTDTRTLSGLSGQHPREVVLTLPAREWSALVQLRDNNFPGQPLELLARKLVQDGLISCGILSLPKGNRARFAGRK